MQNNKPTLTSKKDDKEKKLDSKPSDEKVVNGNRTVSEGKEILLD